MSARYSFTLESQDKRRDLPRRIIIGQNEAETITHVTLKLLAFLIFYRERLQIEANLHQDSIPFIPDLVQLDYELRPSLWIECGECSVNKLNKLAVKAPEAEIWIVKRCLADARHLLRAMEREELRRDRYGLLALDEEMFQEVSGLVQERNTATWFKGEFDPPQLQFDFNGLWFDAVFEVLRY